MGNVRPLRTKPNPTRKLRLTGTDSLPNWADANNRSPKNIPILLTTPKTKRHGSVRIRDPPDLTPMAANRVPDRAVRAIYTVWRFPGDDRAVCGEYPRRGAVYPTSVGDIGGRTTQCGVTCVGGLIEDDLRATSILRVQNYNDDYMHPTIYARRHSVLKIYNYNNDDDDDYMQAKINKSKQRRIVKRIA